MRFFSLKYVYEKNGIKNVQEKKIIIKFYLDKNGLWLKSHHNFYDFCLLTCIEREMDKK